MVWGVGVVIGLSGVASASEISWPNFPADSTCTPAIPNSGLSFGTKADAKASARMKVLYDADQKDRQGQIDWSVVTPRDRAREVETLALLKSGKLSTGTDALGAAFVFQHGNCPNHYLLAHTLAEQALALNPNRSEAKFIFAATLDRYLLSRRKNQKFGGELPTFVQVRDKTGTLTQCIFIELPMDPTTIDAELKKYNLPLLSEIKKRKDGIIKDAKAACKGVPINSQKFYN